MFTYGDAVVGARLVVSAMAFQSLARSLQW